MYEKWVPKHMEPFMPNVGKVRRTLNEMLDSSPLDPKNSLTKMWREIKPFTSEELERYWFKVSKEPLITADLHKFWR